MIMYQGEKKRAFLFSGYSSEFRKAFIARNIIIEDVIEGVHPFAVVGTSDGHMNKYLDGCKDVRIITSIKKNFKNMLSRVDENYESNYVEQPFGKSINYRNETDYLIVDFNSCVNALYKVGTNIYSSIDSAKDFTESISKGERIPIPFPVTFNWEYYAKQFADACTENYDSDHIILIRTNPVGYYCQGHEIHTDVFVTQEMGMQIRAIEDDFISRTHCHCISEFLNYSPIDDRIFVLYPDAYKNVASAVAGIVFGDDDRKVKSYRYSQPLLKVLCDKLTNDKLSMMKKDFDVYDRKVSTEVRKHFLYNRDTDIFATLNILKKFVNEEDRYTLFDYVKEKLAGGVEKVDLRIIELYTEYFKLDISDIVAVYMLYTEMQNKELLRKIVQNICKNSDNYPLISMRKFIKRNQEYLKKYAYIDEELLRDLDFELDEGMMVYPIRISSFGYLILNPSEKGDLIILETWERKRPDVDAIINDMICSPKEIEEISGDWEFYIKRAKKKKGNEPLLLVFKDNIEFNHSLVFLNYSDVLENENAIIVLEKNIKDLHINRDVYKVRCNLECLLEEKTKIFDMRNGLGDQIHYYLSSKFIEEKTGANIIYDDLYATVNICFNGIEIDKILKEGKESFDKKRLSRIISPRLIETCRLNVNLADFLFEKGWKDISGVMIGHPINPFEKCSQFVVKDPAALVFAAKAGFKYYGGMQTPAVSFKKDLRFDKYFMFPELIDSKNKEIQNVMLSCDAVVMHLRLGDMLRLKGAAPNIEFFNKCFNSLLDIKDYYNKKYFVFSDNIPWCRSHESDIFGDLSYHDDIFYISHNKNENAYLDMKLMSFGKIIIASSSGFSFFSAVMSKTREIYISQMPYRNAFFKMLGFKNKYDLSK